MTRWFPVLFAGLLIAVPVQANGLLIPTDTSVPPLALVRHEVKTHLIEQVANTEVTQIFRNHTDRALEATFIFPVPNGASVNRFSMWVNGKEVKGEMIEADKAKQIYTDIVRRSQDPGLLEYIGQNLLKLSVFPIPPKGDQKLTLRFTSVCTSDAGLVEYCYPLKTDQKAAKVLEHFSIDATIESKNKVHNVYSPTHAVTVTPNGDNKTKVHFEAKQATLDKDLKMYFSLGNKDVGLTTLTYRPDPNKDGSFLLLISPRAELSKSQQVSRDMVFVLDQSGSMAGVKMEQAKKAIKHCLDRLTARDRFAVTAFATVVQRQNDKLQQASRANIEVAKKWVDELEPTGGTAIDSALSDAFELRPTSGNRPFTVSFFTDGQPTVGETDPEKIYQHVKERNIAGTRIFTFGVGDDVNAALLDRVAELTRSASAYVRPEEDIESKVSSLYAKIAHPVLTELKLNLLERHAVAKKNGSKPAISRVSYIETTPNVKLSEMYPKQMPDLFHGGQLIVCGRYKGKGPVALTLSGKVDGETKEIVYEVDFPEKTGEDRAFVENLWARRKVGYLLDEIRTNGQQKELIDEVKHLAKKHGITTPYTSYLVVPDNVAVAPATSTPPTSRATAPTPMPISIPPVDWSPYTKYRGYPIHPVQPMATYPNYAPGFVSPTLQWSVPAGSIAPGYGCAGGASGPVIAASTTVPATKAPEPVTASLPTAGKEGVELALVLDELRNEAFLGECKACQVDGKTMREFNGAWIDETFKPGVKVVTVKAQSKAYFALLAKHPALKDVFRLGNRLVWVTPCGTALVIDADCGVDTMSDKDIDALFATKK